MSKRPKPDLTASMALEWDSDECYIWPHAKGNFGYAIWGRGGARFSGLVHRHICFVKNGPPPEDKPFALHKCGNGHLACINPRHLYWGDVRENCRDMVAHGTSPVGEQNKNSKLSETDIRAIRRRLKEGEMQKLIAKDYSITQAHVSRIGSREMWGHLSDLSPDT